MPNKIPHTLPTSQLSRRAALTQTVITAAIVLSMSAVIIVYNANRVNSRIDAKMDSLAHLAKTGLAQAVWQVDHASARNFIISLFRDESVVFAEVITGRETLAVHTRTPYEGKPFLFFKNRKDFRVRSMEIHQYDDWVGTFRLVLSTKTFRDEFLINSAIILSIALILIAAIANAVHRSSRKRFFDPLKQLEISATAIADGDLDAPIDTSLPGELGSLALALDDMRGSSRRLIKDLQTANTKLKTHRNELESSVRIRTEEINAKNASLNQALAEVRQAKQAADVASLTKSRFLASMSHEIRTPMNAILGMADILWESELTEEQKRYVKVFRTAGESLLEILNDVLDLSKIEAGHLHLEMTPFSLSETVDKVCLIIETKAIRKGIGFACTLPPEVPDRLTGDANRLRQVLINLLDNAVKFTQRGSVHLTVEPAPGKRGMMGLQFSVSDTGSGIPANKLGTIFDAFTQADDSTTREHGGTGLGLAISQQLVQMMHGRIWAESTPGRGSVFHFTAFFRESTGASASKPAPSPTTTFTPPGNDQLLASNILMVEDSKYNAFVIQTYLKGTPCRITVAESGEQGLEIFQAGGVDLVLMDIQMPGMDGYEATRAIREWEQEQGLDRTPVVAMTAHAMSDDAEHCLAAGADVHLPKPVKKSALLEIITRFCGRRDDTEPWTNAQATPEEAQDLLQAVHQANKAFKQGDLATVRTLGEQLAQKGEALSVSLLSKYGNRLAEAEDDAPDNERLEQSLSILTEYVERLAAV